MESYGIWSVIPPLAAIILAIRTRKVFIALFGGIWLAWVVMHGGNPFRAFYDAVMSLVRVFQSEGNTKTIMFSALVGALILFVQKSGGTEGFVRLVRSYLDKLETVEGEGVRRKIALMAWLTGILVFVETSISSLTVGTVFRPLFDKYRISREKLAYLADSSSAPVSVLLPFNAWGAFIMGLLLTEGMDKPFAILLRTIPYNFYAWAALVTGLIAVWAGWHPGPMKDAERRVRETGEVLNPGAVPMVSDELTAVEPVPGVRPRAAHMLVPIAVMVLMMPVLLVWTGWDAGVAAMDGPLSKKLMAALGNGSGSTAVLFAVITALAVAGVMYRLRRIATFYEMHDWVLKGISAMMPLALLMMMAFAIGAVTKQLGTGEYLAGLAGDYLHPRFIPVILFLLSAFIAFSTGTSWGTFAIMIPIAVPVALRTGIPVELAVAAVLSGGVFGDHASPISDTTIISSMAAATDHIDHVKTQLPYALISAAAAALLFLAAGWKAA
ncbi:MAG: sodium:solute symporter [Chlorobi bacterium]|nr:sodium:solute symporter [Chlorobiota bacterium]